jgi:hypothetical protein
MKPILAFYEFLLIIGSMIGEIFGSGKEKKE